MRAGAQFPALWFSWLISRRSPINRARQSVSIDRPLCKRFQSGGIKMFIKKFCAALCVLSVVPAAAIAAPATGDAQIAVVTPLSFIQVEDLQFGRIVPSATAGSVTISPTNVRTTNSGIIALGTDYQMAKFAGMGSQSQQVRIQISPSSITLSGPGSAMTVDTFTIEPQATLQFNGGDNYTILPADGIFWFNVGGTLNVGANQAAGTYTGTFAATLDYL